MAITKFLSISGSSLLLGVSIAATGALPAFANDEYDDHGDGKRIEVRVQDDLTFTGLRFFQPFSKDCPWHHPYLANTAEKRSSASGATNAVSVKTGSAVDVAITSYNKVFFSGTDYIVKGVAGSWSHWSTGESYISIGMTCTNDSNDALMQKQWD